MRRWLSLFAIAAALTAGCSSPRQDPIQLDGNMLTLDNRTSQEWTHVEIWLNTYYRVTAASIPPDGRFQAPLDTFVAGFGQRFNFHRTQIKDLRVTATLPDGKKMELKKQFAASGLAGALGGKRP